MEVTTVIIIIVALILLSGLLSACCRAMKKAYDSQENARRRRGFYISQASRNIQTLNGGRQVRVTTISRASDSVAYEIYEIHVPSRSNRSQTESGVHNQQQQNDAATDNNSIFGRSYNPNRRLRPLPPSSYPEISTPPPPAFNIALQVSSPISNPSILPEEPPPSYEESTKLRY